jgi:ATP-dependent Clp protease ATP-binding subunit ClpB
LIQNSQVLASQHNHQQIEPEHLLAVILGEPEGIAVAMLRKLGVSPDEISRETMAAVEKFPTVSGGGVGETYLSPRAKAVLEAAFAEATIH